MNLTEYFRQQQRKSAEARWGKLTAAQRSAKMRKLSRLAAAKRTAAKKSKTP